MQIVRMCSPILIDVKRIDMSADKDSLFKLFNVASEIDGNAHLKVLRQYLILLLCPPIPFFNEATTPVDFGEAILERLQKPAMANATNKELKIKNEM